MVDPVVTCTARPHTLTITIPQGDWTLARDMFLLVASALEAGANQIPAYELEGLYLGVMAEQIKDAVDQVQEQQHASDAHFFG